MAQICMVRNVVVVGVEGDVEDECHCHKAVRNFPLVKFSLMGDE